MGFLLLAKAKPIRSNGNASVITCLRTESAEGGGGGAPGTGAEALQPVAKTLGRQVVLQPMEDHQCEETHLQPMEKAMLEQRKSGRLALVVVAMPWHAGRVNPLQ
ncbi:hypothetical protein BTVI_55929 [Pitangus sulphuratus]|nr:hypothetical protein BTVI_55929 [Pitangus sulphuratus]